MIDVLPKLRLGVAGALLAAAVTVNVTEVGFETPLVLEQLSVYVSVPTAVGVSV